MERPTRENVNIGDLLVVEKYRSFNDFVSAPVTSVDEKFINAKTLYGSYYSQVYAEALIIKKDKSFLIGERFPENLLKSDIFTRDKLCPPID